MDRQPNDVERRLRRLEGWSEDHARELRELERTLSEHRSKYEPFVDGMVERDRVQDKVSEALAEAAKATRQTIREQNRAHLSWWQLTIAVAVALCTLATTLVTVLR